MEPDFSESSVDPPSPSPTRKRAASCNSGGQASEAKRGIMSSGSLERLERLKEGLKEELKEELKEMKEKMDEMKKQMRELPEEIKSVFMQLQFNRWE